ncbi:MAG: NAD(P)/FAD-dependent oxidoreductase [Ginsengibacter sp.]
MQKEKIKTQSNNLFDVIIIGGGPAGLNAAVVLGRCNRKVLLFDHGKQRNRYSHGMHNYLTRDDITPTKFLQISKNELRKYGVKVLRAEVKHAKKDEDGNFVIMDLKEKTYYSKKLILATGLTDNLPEIKGINKFYGKSIYHCPYCDGWENNHKTIGVYSKSRNGVDVALTLTAWSSTITLYTDGKKYLTKKDKDLLAKKSINVINEPIDSFEGKGSELKNIVFANGDKSFCEALFFSNGYSVQCHLVESLGCKVNENNIAITNKSQQTNITGLYAAGDISKDVHFVVVAAAEGAKAAVYINKELMEEEIKF